MMLTPCWPSAGPTGGAGLAAPAWIWSLISPVTFFFLGGIPGPLSFSPSYVRVETRTAAFNRANDPDAGIPHNDNGYLCAAKNRAGQTGCVSPSDLFGRRTSRRS